MRGVGMSSYSWCTQLTDSFVLDSKIVGPENHSFMHGNAPSVVVHVAS